MRIIRFQAANTKRIKLVDITPNKYVNRVSGGNGEGKSSVLDAIEWVLVGGKNIPSQPVRRGAVNGKIKIDMGEEKAEVVLTRSFQEGSNKRAGRLEVAQLPGADASEFQDKRKKITTPDELEDALLKQVSFDPLEFMRMEAKKQYHVLRRISTPDIDMDALDEEIQKNYDLRTPAGRKADELEAQRNAILVPEGLPTEKIDEASMVKQLAEASDYNAGIERERQKRAEFDREAAQVNNRAKSRADRMQELREELEREEIALRQDLDRGIAMEKQKAAWEPLADPRDSAALVQSIDEARALNRSIDRAQLRAKFDKEYAESFKEWKTLDDAVKEGERRKKEAIAHAKYPVEGLGFGNQEVMYKGFPFDQASDAERIRVSAAIGMATNSKVRVMRIKDGSLLDDKSLAIIAEMAVEHDFQVWIECVDTTGGVGFYMEDGEVKTVNEEPLNAPKTPAKKATPAKSKKKVKA